MWISAPETSQVVSTIEDASGSVLSYPHVHPRNPRGPEHAFGQDTEQDESTLRGAWGESGLGQICPDFFNVAFCQAGRI